MPARNAVHVDRENMLNVRCCAFAPRRHSSERRQYAHMCQSVSQAGERRPICVTTRRTAGIRSAERSVCAHLCTSIRSIRVWLRHTTFEWCAPLKSFVKSQPTRPPQSLLHTHTHIHAVCRDIQIVGIQRTSHSHRPALSIRM